MSASPFDGIESAQAYVRLLGEVVDETRKTVAEDITSIRLDSDRRLEALRLVEYKLIQLRNHLTATGKLLNDLRRLERLLMNDPEDEPPADAEPVPVAVHAS